MPTSTGERRIPAVDATSQDVLALRSREPLVNQPEIVSVINDGIECDVTIKNAGETTLLYYSTESGHIQIVQEEFRDGSWHYVNYDWCGTGKGNCKLPPGESTVLHVKFWSPDKRERMLAQFTEEGSWRAGLVVLAAEPLGVR